MKEKIPYFGIKNVIKRQISSTARLDNDVLMIHLPIEGMVQDMIFAFEYATCTIVDSGEATIIINMQEYHLIPGSFLVALAEQVSVFKSCSTDFTARCLLMSGDFLISLNIEDAHNLYQSIKTTPHVNLNNQARESIELYLQMLESALVQNDNPHKREIIYHLTKAYFYGLGYYINPIQQQTVCSRSQQITSDFFDLLQKHFRTERKVRFYADQLHITPKYLAACIKECTGNTAIHCIENQTILYAQNMLANTNIAINQLSEELNFDSPSTFGKYFRTAVGMSPKEWRLKMGRSR